MPYTPGEYHSLLTNGCYTHIRGRVHSTSKNRWYWEVVTFDDHGERVGWVAGSDEFSFAGAFEAAEAATFIARGACFYNIRQQRLKKPIRTWRLA